jgi:CheY-specific phosphatase CheX
MLGTIEQVQEQIPVIVDDVFLAMLGVPVVSHPSPPTVEEEILTGSVFFVGAWKGGVSIEMGVSQAIHLTKCLNSSASPSGVDDDVRDAIGELANMIGGNLKASLPSGAHLSVPSVVRGTDYNMRMCGVAEITSFGFSTEWGPFWVRVIHVIQN